MGRRREVEAAGGGLGGAGILGLAYLQISWWSSSGRVDVLLCPVSGRLIMLCSALPVLLCYGRNERVGRIRIRKQGR